MGSARWLIGCLFVAACGHGGTSEPAVPDGNTIGLSTRPYGGVPPYLQSTRPLPSGPVGRYDDRVPVAGKADDPPRDALDAVRLHLARIDEMVVGLRAAREKVPDEAIGELRDHAQMLRSLVGARPDLIAEAEELEAIASRLGAASDREREQLLVRIQQLTDLLRIQIAATTSTTPLRSAGRPRRNERNRISGIESERFRCPSNRCSQTEWVITSRAACCSASPRAVSS